MLIFNILDLFHNFTVLNDKVFISKRYTLWKVLAN